MYWLSVSKDEESSIYLICIYILKTFIIDLIDREKKIVIQVSATNTKQKIDNAITKPSVAEYVGWSFKFISIARSAGNLKSLSFNNKHGLHFNPAEDIYDIDTILRKVLGLTTERLQSVADFIKIELGNDVFAAALESDLARVILMLTKIDVSEFESIRIENEFQIDEKIDYNSLSSSVGIIKEYNIWQTAVRRVYATFDAEGMNKSFFVLKICNKHFTSSPLLPIFLLLCSQEALSWRSRCIRSIRTPCSP